MSRNYRRALGVTAVACGLATTPLVTPSAQSAPSAEPCPDVRNHATDPLVRGDTVQGLTVSSGKATDTFTGELVGVLDDGIAPGFDMILAELEGSQITDEAGTVKAGIWAGMSGSPVYDDTGKLLGAVAYSLTFGPSDLAGITPATEMFALRQATAPARVAIPGPMAARVVAATEATPAQANAGMRQLPMPVTVSGTGGGDRSAERVNRLADRAELAALFTGSGARAAATEVVDPMIPGGNVAASLSYGDVSLVGVGTVTAVCDKRVLAFGHPMLFTGDSRLTMHGADALSIVRDPVFGAFKLADATAPVGGIVQDRLAAILGIEGAAAVPATSAITSQIRSQGRSRAGTTLSSLVDEMPFITAIHLLVNGDRVFDRIAKGTATIRWRVQIDRRHGRPLLTYVRSDRIVSAFDLSQGLAVDAFEQLSLIQRNRFEDVRIADVDVDVAMRTGMRTLQVRRLQYRSAGRWITLGKRAVLHRPAGTVLRLRTRLAPPRGSEAAARWKRLSLPLPDRAAGTRGRLQVIGGNSTSSRPVGNSLPNLVDNMANATRNDSVAAHLKVGRPRARIVQRSTVAPTTAVVNGRLGVRLVVH